MSTAPLAADGPLAALQRGLPKPAAALIERIFICQHLAGEEPYDPARAAELAEAERKYHCRNLPADEQRILARYQHLPLVHARITKAHSGEW